MLSKKEAISVLLLVTALICVLNASVFGAIMPIPSSYAQLAQQVISVGTAYMCILHGLSTWLYHSNYSEPRRHIRYVLIAMLIILIVANVAALWSVIHEHFTSPVNEAIRMWEIFSPFRYACRVVTLILFILTILLLLVILVIVVRAALRRLKYHDTLRVREVLP